MGFVGKGFLFLLDWGSGVVGFLNLVGFWEWIWNLWIAVRFFFSFFGLGFVLE